MKNRKGSIMIDFVFGLTMTAGVSAVLLALCFTMAMVEVSQYIAFASSRAYFSGHLNEGRQIERGKEKFDNLMAVRPFKVMLKESGWFLLTFVNSGDFRGEYQEFQPHDLDTFFGTQLKFKANVLDLRLPLLDPTAGDIPYEAILTSYLGREPTVKECLDFERERWTQFISRTGFPTPAGSNPVNDFAVVTDNGC